jgi:uncharacterized membrane protein YjjP (DUF1212 family)
VRVKGIPSIDLNKVHQVNDLSRRFERGLVVKEEVGQRLDEIERAGGYYRLRYQHLAAALSSGAFAVLFGGGWPEFWLGALCGWLSNTVLSRIPTDVPSFLRVFLAALVGVMLAMVGVQVSAATQLEAVILGAVIPLVPGVAVTNAVRDLMAGELLAGVARAAEAFLTAFAIAVAVALLLAVRLKVVEWL